LGKQSAPKAPDPYQTASAQTGSNIGTAIAQSQLNSINQVTPYGSLAYSQSGTYDFTDPTTGKTYKLPKMTATTSLTPAQQQLLNSTQGTQQNLADTAKDQSVRLDELLSQPFSLDNDAVEGRIADLSAKRLDPQLARKRDQFATTLSNQGIKVGSTAWDEAMGAANRDEADSRNALLLSGRSQAVQEALAARSQPLNEIIGLASGTQVNSPSFTSTPQTGVAGTDISGLINSDYQNRLSSYNQSQSDMLGGLFALGSAAFGMFSDKRLKTDIEETGEEVAGVPVKTWRWKGTDEPDVGVIAQDVEAKHPEMVDHSDPSGYRKVDYRALMAHAVRQRGEHRRAA
jgi:hypothetical protein